MILARVAAGEANESASRSNPMDRHGDKSLLARELMLEYLADAVSRSVQPTEHPDTITLDATQDRLGFYIGMRPVALRTAFEALRSTQDPARKVITLHRDSCVVNLKKLSQEHERGGPVFALPLEMPYSNDNATEEEGLLI